MASDSDQLPSQILEAWPSVRIDKGVFKYVLIEAYATDPGTDTEHSKLLVRGLVSAEYHADVYEHEEELLRKSSGGLDCQCLGGGRILHEPQRKYIKVYGYSVGYGKADHTKSVELLKKHYPNYEIEWSDDGY